MLGSTIRSIRLGKGLALKDVAEKTQLTSSYLSQVENEIIDPSLSSLNKIAVALEVPIYKFLAVESKQHVLITGNQRKKLELPNSTMTYEFITPMAADKSTNPKMEMIYFQLEPQKWSNEEMLCHSADECIYLIEGTIDVYLGEERYTLNASDSIYICENVPHRLYNRGDKKAVGISNICPPIY